MEMTAALARAAEIKRATFATLRPDGRPHLSVVYAVVIDDRLWISTLGRSVKARNARSDPRCSIAFGIRPWVAFEGRAAIIEGEGLLEKLRRYYREAAGEHPDWDDYDRAMVRDGRLIVEIVPERAYGGG